MVDVVELSLSREGTGTAATGAVQSTLKNSNARSVMVPSPLVVLVYVGSVGEGGSRSYRDQSSNRCTHMVC